MTSMQRCLVGALLLSGIFTSAVEANQQVKQTPLPGDTIPKFKDPLPIPKRVTGSTATVNMVEFQQKVLPASLYPKTGTFSKGTYLWGYDVNGHGPSWPGATFQVTRLSPLTVTYINNIKGPFNGAPVLEKFLTIDQSVHWADPPQLMCEFKTYTCGNGSTDPCCKPYGFPSWNGNFMPFSSLPDEGAPIPAVVHLHGSEVPSAFDGGPDEWFTPDGQHGPGYRTLTNTASNSAVFRYPNSNEATNLWYHDHALGITRVTIYAGLAGFYLIRDSRDTGMTNNPIGLPAGKNEIEMLVQDRQFDTNGQLLFPDTGEVPSVHPFAPTTFLGDVVVVNGKSWPYLDVEARRYRFRLLNASNDREFVFALSNGMPFWQIGTDGGLLDQPVSVQEITLGSAERADVVVDFSSVKPGTNVVLENHAVNSRKETTRVVMQFRVKKRKGNDATCDPSVTQSASNACILRTTPMVRLTNSATGELASGVQISVDRQLVLNDVIVGADEQEILQNNTKWLGLKESTMKTGSPQPIPDSEKTNGIEWFTELPRVGSTEVWEIANLTDDDHPMHIHLVQFQILNRQPFDAASYQTLFQANTTPGDGPPNPYNTPNADGAIGGNFAFSGYLTGNPVPPAAYETGWKDTVIAPPGMITRIVPRWARQDVPVAGVQPGQNTYPFDPTLMDPNQKDSQGNPGGPGYVWHCHILNHEDSEMMRPYAVKP